jgi:tetratricopeptide (TPR) repeat protein
MGEVYAAYHPELDRRIALKVVGESSANGHEHRARLLREARAIARLSHPNVIAVHDAGTVGDRVYIAMEFVEGETVDAWLRAQSRSWREVLDVFVAAGRGLAAAHAAGVVHRDFKPQNVMIGRDGSVRVMDFGLARLAEEPVDSPGGADAEPRPIPTTVTRTGAVVGTLAYMAPEQFRGETPDARADQFSFCVALHEAMYGARPALAHLPEERTQPARPGIAPAWLRGVVARGLADRRAERFASMDDLMRALVKGRSRPRRRALGAGVSVAIMLVALGGWRVARGGRISCAVPSARLDAAWSGRDDSRRQSVHRAFVASGRPTAEISWQRVAKALDDYMSQWSAMYVATCEATHVRGEQSGEVLDLRMSCLTENLDDVKALTSVLGQADANAISHAVTAVQGLPHIRRCADVTALRSAVPLPRDPRTLETVRALRSGLKELQALRDVGGDNAKLLKRANALRPQVEATKYAPLLAELLELIGSAVDSTDDLASAEVTLHEALFAAESARDDATAARVAADLVYVGTSNRLREAEMWFRLSQSILDRLGPEHERTRAWALHDFAIALYTNGEFARAETSVRAAIAIKERILGRDHPDVAISLQGLANVLLELERPAEALAAINRAIDIDSKNGDPESSLFAFAHTARGEALLGLGRPIEAEAAFRMGWRLRSSQPGDDAFDVSFALQGIGDVKLAQGDPRAARPFLEQALRVREGRPLKIMASETQYSLARALWASGGDRRRAVQLAGQSRDIYTDYNFSRKAEAIAAWLATHKLVNR